MPQSKVLAALSQITEELKNFEEIALTISPRPGSIPELDGIDVAGKIMPLNGVVGGDHLIYMDFKKRYDLDARIERAERKGKSQVAENLKHCKNLAGIVVFDVSGHQTTDAMLAAMVHQAFLMGALYELDMCGQITSKLFENLNTRLHTSSVVHKFITAVYGEISADAHFRFLSAAHPAPVIFSAAHDRFVEICPDLLTTFPPLGTIPSVHDIDRGGSESVLGFKNRYEVNELKLMGSGDIMLLHTDGLSEHTRGEEPYFPNHLEDVIRHSKRLPAAEIVEAIQADLLEFADPEDDITLVVIKRN